MVAILGHLNDRAGENDENAAGELAVRAARGLKRLASRSLLEPVTKLLMARKLDKRESIAAMICRLLHSTYLTYLTKPSP